jgi:hypothetical protein
MTDEMRTTIRNINTNDLSSIVMSILTQVLVDRDPAVLATYMTGIQKLLTTLYGEDDALQTTLLTQFDTELTVPQQLFVFLTTLNKEDALKRYIRDQPGQSEAKLERFWAALRRLTETELLSFSCTETEYIQRCIDHWVIA